MFCGLAYLLNRVNNTITISMGWVAIINLQHKSKFFSCIATKEFTKDQNVFHKLSAVCFILE